MEDEVEEQGQRIWQTAVRNVLHVYEMLLESVRQ